jgi:maltose/maltodextrin transport system permease protein
MTAIDRIFSALKWPFTVAAAVGALYLVFSIYASGNPVWAVLTLGLFALGFYVYMSDGLGFAWRYLFPGVIAMLIFVAFPLFYTAQIGFTNYSSNNLLSFERARNYLLEQSVPDDRLLMSYTLHTEGNEFRIVLSDQKDDGMPVANASYVSPSLALLSTKAGEKVTMLPTTQGSFQINAPLSLKEVIAHRDSLRGITLVLPDGNELNYAGVREFAPLKPMWVTQPDGSLRQSETGQLFKPNDQTGFFENAQGERMQPGYKVGVGFANYTRMLFDKEFRGPFVKIFIWTVAFSLLTVASTMCLGMLLAVLLNWESLKGRGVYRMLLFLPYAVPTFISILVFKGLFNQNFGEINIALNALFGIKPAWFADPWLAKLMILIVNTWLGYPYFMILCSGVIQAISKDLYEASAIAGASPWDNLTKITAPLIVKPLLPLVVSVFAFNFNNFVVIALLTDGRPDFLNTKVPGGTTDILVSYTYRIAFQDAGQNFGLAAAISTVIFFIVAMLSLANLKLMERAKKSIDTTTRGGH